MMLAIDALNRRKEDPIKDAVNDHLAKDIKLKDAPLKLEDGVKIIEETNLRVKISGNH